MELGTVMVLVLIALATVFLVYAERNSRQNESKEKSEADARMVASAKPDVTAQDPPIRQARKAKLRA